ncbi:glycoside hydrolase family 16 protein [Conidiobolus coronatus NRRL 28638]|uniref:Glycoside hydrolase family 16 protein n=1 Tax=Conidiobolus coronatus (strain ATCC 28846 / CBS 209.66 / NRRL 28638) TaxID=796925 RepID=A0A137PGV4_CONC2|nr:glycoside hydrolase family 16 protein [Conidiobolus coronatus NRRL 28638]|eukprot:KXN74234.1 glycoside hydrolase family 16 protein [Conidiobolus coronatus NRRL 28638]
MHQKNAGVAESANSPIDRSIPRRSSELIDPNTPNDVRTMMSTKGEELQLVFSDEFDENGRKFGKGQDPFWEAVDLWYEPTGDLEYYHPDQVTTKDGNMVITLERKAVGELEFSSGMVQSWNKFCFQGGRLEVKVRLPGDPLVEGLWPGAWTLGNLGRAGYKATTDGVWPYSYDSCDNAVKANQSLTNGLSHLPGQRLNACVCTGDHPNPGHGRGAPEIDLIEATSHHSGAEVSQSLQVAPFDEGRQFKASDTKVSNGKTKQNDYLGSPLQQSISALTRLDEKIFEKRGGEFQTFSIEYDYEDDGYITWFVGKEETWTVNAGAIGANPASKVADRKIPEEPMYIILNLALSKSFAKGLDTNKLELPSEYLIDYVRLYQNPNKKKVSCDPKSHPTKDYIENHPKAYYNKNFTSWKGAGYSLPQYTVSDKKC